MKTKTIYLSTTFVIVWFAIILQFILGMKLWLDQGMTVFGSVVQFFSFFTILSNILVGLCVGSLLATAFSGSNNFLTRPPVLTAVTVYITVVGLGYAFLLRHLWNPQGLQWVADELLHSVSPILFVLFWLIFVPKKELNYTHILSWMVFPFLYIVFILIRGALADTYPYPFIDVNELGYVQVTTTMLVFTGAFIFLSAMFVLAGKVISKMKE